VRKNQVSEDRLTLASRCSAIELLLLDVDGVLTDGSIVYADNSVEVKSFHVRDGSGLKLWHRAGKRSAIISGRKSPVVEIRAAELGIGKVIQGAADKQAGFAEVLNHAGVRAEQVCFIGDDLPDLPLLVQCGLAVAVADACVEVRAAAQYITRLAGGRGAVREVIEMILRCQGRWREVIEPFVSSH
jgi:3-deoxy-D-manno-octulosonate 8-phosphate phosphatase (KDO 8-P phosphatase)